LRKFTDLHRKRLSEAHKGKKRTPEALAKFKATMKQRWADPEFRKRICEARKGHYISEETKRKISKAHLSISSEKEEQIVKLYKNLTADEISLKLNLGSHVVYSCLKRNKVEKRPIGHRIGRPSWNSGIKFSEEQKVKLNIKGLDLGRAWNKGKTGIYSEDRLRQMSEFMKAKIGEKACNWKGGISRAYKTGYNSIQYKEWRKKIFNRDNYTCQDCGIHASEVGYLTAHHVKSWSECPELRFEISNGKTLCENCHSKIDNYRARFMNGRI